MNTHTHISESDLASYIDGQLPRPERERRAGHLTTCDSCRRSYNELSLGRLAVHSLSTPSMPEGIWDRIESTLRPPSQTRLTLFQPRRIAVAASILLIAVLSVLFMGQDKNGRPQLAGIAPFDWGIFLYDLDHPDNIPRLGRAYLIRDASLSAALESGGVLNSASLDRLEGMIEFVSARILENGDDRAGILKFRGEPGTVYILVQPEDSPVSFAGFRVEMDTVVEKECYSVYCTRFRAISFVSEGTTYTVVASRDSEHIAKLVSLVSGSMLG